MKNSTDENKKIIELCDRFLAHALELKNAGVDLSDLQFSIAGHSVEVNQMSEDLENNAPAPTPSVPALESGRSTDMTAEYLLMHVRGFEPLQYFVDYEVALSDSLILTADISKAHHFDDFNEVQWAAILLDIQGYGFSVLLPDGSYSDIYTTAAHAAVAEYYKDEGAVIGDSK